MTEENELTEEQKKEQELAKEKAQAWLIGQEYARKHLNLTALQRAQKEKELEEMQEVIDDAIDEITEGGEEENGKSESGQPAEGKEE
jgi:phage terminase large subunit-like protein